MNEITFRAKTTRLFLLFAMLPEIGEWAALVDAAIDEVRRELRADADPFDIRLSYYAAALANLRCRQILAAQGAVSPTYAGSVSAQRGDSQPVSLAVRLFLAYRSAAAELLCDSGFVMILAG